MPGDGSIPIVVVAIASMPGLEAGVSFCKEKRNEVEVVLVVVVAGLDDIWAGVGK